MDDVVRVVIALAGELADQARGGAVDPALVRRTKEATRRLYAGLEHLPPPLRRRAQRIVQDAATIVGTVERQFGMAPPPRPKAAPAPPRRAPEPAPAPPQPAGALERPLVAQSAAEAQPAVFDPNDIRSGIIWGAILGPPRGVDPGW